VVLANVALPPFWAKKPSSTFVIVVFVNAMPR